MNLQQQNYTGPMETAAPILFLLSGWVFCVIVILINTVIVALGDAVTANYLISKSYYPLNNFWLIESIFAGFIAIGLLSMMRGKGKICSAILIVSCIAVAPNLAATKAEAKKGHMQRILALEAGLIRAQTEPASEPYPSDVISIYMARYKGLVDIWNELHKDKYGPRESYSPPDSRYTNLIRHQVLGSPPWGVPKAYQVDLRGELLHPWHSISGQCSVIIEYIQHLAKTTNTPPKTIASSCTSGGQNSTGFRFGFSEGCLAISTNGWFQFVTHSSHHDYTVGDISIGRDHKDNYYFSRQHVCAGHPFQVGPSKEFVSMQDFLTRNLSWHLITNIDEWEKSNKFTGQLFKEYGTFYW